MNLLELSLNELKQGYHEQNQQLHCNYCDCVFPLMQKESPELMAAHLKTLHGPNHLQLIQLDSKYNNNHNSDIENNKCITPPMKNCIK